MIQIAKPKDHVILTARDYEILKELHDNVVMAFYQIHERFFQNRNHATVLNRLRQLEKGNFITRTRIPRIKAWNGKKEIGVVFQVTSLAVKHLRAKFLDWEFIDKTPNINPLSLDHDLLLNEIKPFLLEKYPGFICQNGRHLMTNQRLHKIPDLVFKVPGSDLGMAIELELHCKSSSRYRQILSEFRASSKIKEVIYITAHDQIARKIQSEIVGYEVGKGEEVRTENFTFLPLSEILKHKQKVNLCVGGHV